MYKNLTKEKLDKAFKKIYQKAKKREVIYFTNSEGERQINEAIINYIKEMK